MAKSLGSCFFDSRCSYATAVLFCCACLRMGMGMGITQWEFHGNGNKTYTREWEGMGIDCMGNRRELECKNPCRSSLLQSRCAAAGTDFQQVTVLEISVVLKHFYQKLS